MTSQVHFRMDEQEKEALEVVLRRRGLTLGEATLREKDHLKRWPPFRSLPTKPSLAKSYQKPRLHRNQQP